MSVTLFNRGKRNIVGTHPGKFEKDKLDKHGKPLPLKFAFKPETAMAFDGETAAKLQRLYPGEVLSVQEVQKQFEPVNAAPAYDEEAHKAELEAKLQVAKEKRDATVKAAYEKALAEGFSDDEAREIAGLPFQRAKPETVEEVGE